MISRKIMKRLEAFYSEGGRSALLIDGARQVGKTYIIEEFGRTHYEGIRGDSPLKNACLLGFCDA